jgi:16S rRNA processing protein RimM
MARLTLGRVAGVFGVRGWVKLHSLTEPAENLLDYPRWQLVGRESFETKLLEGRVHGHGLVAQITDASGAPITDRDAAAKLLGYEIQVERAELPKLRKGEYYWVDLEGLQVETPEGVRLGKVAAVTDNGAQAVLVVRDGSGDGTVERLIPFVHGPIIRSVDLKGGVIVADWAPDW